MTLGVPLGIVLGAVLWWFARDPLAGAGESPVADSRGTDAGRGAALLADRQREGAPTLLGGAPVERLDGVTIKEVPSLETKDPLPPPPPREFVGAAAILHVTVRFPEEWRGLDGVVYALPAGAPGRDGDELLPHVAVRLGAADATLPLPEEGPWDVGFRGQYGHVLVEGVDARGTTDVVIDARGAAPIRLRVRGKERPSGHWRFSLACAGVDHPGRGQSFRVHWSEPLGEDGALLSPPFVTGTTFRIGWRVPSAQRAPAGVPGFDWVPSRETVRAGEEVELFPVRLGLVRVALELDPPLPEAWVKEWKTDVWTSVAAQGERDCEPMNFASTYLQRDGTFKDAVLLLPLVPGRYTLHMLPTPHLFQRAPTPIEIVAGETIDVRVRATPDPGRSPLRAVPPEQEAAMHVLLEISPPSARTWFVAGETLQDERLEWSHWGQETGATLEVSGTPSVRRALVFVPPDRASEVFAMPARGNVPVRLLPAGHLVFVPELLPDPRLGAFQVRRADGLPLPRPEPQKASAEADPERYQLQFDVLLPLTMGLVVGPVPEGPLPLEVLLGGTVIARPVATVRAGKHTPVSIPVRAGPER